MEEAFKPRILPHSQFGVRRSFILSPGSKFIYPRLLKDPANVNSCIEYYLFIGEVSDRKMRALLNIFSQMTEEPAFDQLRTKEQLGYIVFSGGHMASTTMGYRVLVQSERSAAYLEGRIEKFLTSYQETLEKMPEKDFQNHINSLLKKKTEKLKNLNQETERYWNYVGNEFYDFYQSRICYAPKYKPMLTWCKYSRRRGFHHQNHYKGRSQRILQGLHPPLREASLQTFHSSYGRQINPKEYCHISHIHTNPAKANACPNSCSIYE